MMPCELVTGTPEWTRVEHGCIHGEFCLYPQKAVFTSHSRSRFTLNLVPSIIAVLFIKPPYLDQNLLLCLQ